MRRRSRIGYRTGWRQVAGIAGMGLLFIIAAIALLNLERPRVRVGEPSGPRAAETAAGEARARTDPPPIAAPPEPPPSPATPNEAAISAEAPPAAASGEAAGNDMVFLKARNLLIPVAGVSPSQLRDSFFDSRSEERTHEALDIMAAQDTPVLAAADGRIVRLFQSDKGGITIYQADALGPYVYYYAHLSRYTEGLQEGQTVRRGEVIAYVGDTGNAGPGNYHLHFGVYKVSAPGKWSGGMPINPFPLLQ